MVNEILLFFYFIGNGGGSGGRISIYLSEYMLFNGNLIATGGNGSYPGGPGTVYVQSDVGTDRWRELWIDNLNRGNENTCTYETSIDNIQLDNIHLNNRACAILTKVIKTIIGNFDTFPLISPSDIVSIKETNSEIIGQEHI
jgi:hypothetical protein